jgi:Tfp pilus assembly protein PilF
LTFEHFKYALEMDPGYADFHFYMAMAYEKTGLVDTANRHWEEYLKIDPHSEWAELMRGHLRCE